MLKYIKDLEAKGHVWVFTNGPQEMVDFCCDRVHTPGLERHLKNASTGWHGRTFENGIADLRLAFKRPDKDARHKVEEMIRDIRKELPTPTDIRRKRSWSSEDGDVDVDRAIRGDGEYMRDTKRAKRISPKNIAVVLNIGNTGMWTPEQIFFRGAAAVACVDLLEEAGYSCEVTVWNHAQSTHKYPYPSSFVACKVKDCHQIADIDMLTGATSAWFFRCVVMPMRDIINRDERYSKFSYRGSHDYLSLTGSSHDYIGGFAKHLDVTEGIQLIRFKSSNNRNAIIQSAKKLLEAATNPDVEKLEDSIW